MLYRFDDFELDPGAYVLKRSGVVLPLQPKVLDVLRYLVEHPGQMVSKTELLEQLWPGEHVGDAALSWSVSHLRRALGQDRSARSPIETVHRRGYRFNAALATGAAPPRPQRRLTPAPQAANTLVGRERVMTELQRHVQHAAAGHGSLCVLTGEPGIGKTRCTDELIARAPVLGVRALFGRCPQEPDTPPLWPILSALAQVGDDQPELRARARALMSEAGGAGEAVGGAGDESTRFFRIEQVASLLRQLAATRPTLLILDDLHWADAASMRLLAFIAPELRELPLCIVATMRDTERESGAPNDPTRLQVARHAVALPLAALDGEQVAELVAALSGRRPSAELAEAVRRAASGIPLFVDQVVRTLVLDYGPDALSRLSPDAVRVPELARDLLRQRIERLPPDTVELLSRAAVLGESFDLSLLAVLVELEPEVLLDRLDPALTEGQLKSEAPHIYRFAHALYQTVLYDELPAAQRVAIHYQVGKLIEARPDAGQRKGEIARHYYLALPVSKHEEVVERARAAGAAAARAFAFEEAAGYFSWVLEAQAFVGVVDPRARAELLSSLAAVQRSAGRTSEALETAGRLIELAQEHRMHDLIVAAVRLRRPTVAMASVSDRVARAALEVVLQQAPAAAIRASALAQLASLPPFDPDLASSQALSAEAVALAEPLQDRECLLEALRARLFALSGPSDVDAVLAVADRMLALSRKGPGTWQSGDARIARYTACLLAGRIPEADAVLDEMTATLPGAYFREATFYCERLRAQRLFLDGHFDASEERWKAAFDKAVRAGVSYAELFRSAQVLALAVERHGAAAVVGGLRAFAMRPNVAVATRAGMARLAAQGGDLQLVRELLSTLKAPQDYPRDAGYLQLLASLSVCAAALQDEARCEQLLTLLSPYAGFNTPDALGYYLGSVSHFLGLTCAALGRSERATGHFARALEHNRAMGYRAGVVRTLLASAGLEQGLGHADRARALLQDAAAAAEELGMLGALADARRALAEA